MVITVGNTKGGVGKTTIAVNLAVASVVVGKQRTLIIDADAQGSSMDFRAVREKDLPPIQAISLTKPTIHEDIKSFTNFDVIFIDAGGRDGKVFRSALLACDIFLIPITPSPYDIWAAEETLEITQEARLMNPTMQVFIVLNMVIPNTQLSKEVLNLLDKFKGEFNLRVCHTQLVNRQDYKKSATVGQGVVEMFPESKADLEVQELYQEVMGYGNSSQAPTGQAAAHPRAVY